MLNSINLSFFRLIIALNVSACLLSACQNDNKPILINQPTANVDTKNKKQKIRVLPKAIIQKQKPAKISSTKTNSDRSTEAKKYMVAAANPLAAQAGLAMLKIGGSAADAAIATQLALNVVEPQSSGIGGGAFLMHYQSSSRIIEAYDGREKAPAAATGNMFLKPDGSRPNFYDVVPGGLSVGVPGAIRMLELVHKKHGKLPWKKLFEPAIKLAEKGFKISTRLHYLIKIDRFLK